MKNRTQQPKKEDRALIREAAKDKSYTLGLQNGDFIIEVCTDHARMYLAHYFEREDRKGDPINKTFEYTCKPNKPEDGTGQITPGVILLMDSNAINLNPSLGLLLSIAWDAIKNSTAKSSTRIERSMFPVFKITLASEESCNLQIYTESIPEVLGILAKNPNNTLAKLLSSINMFNGIGKIVAQVASKVMNDKENVPLPIQDVLVKGEILNKIFEDIQSTKDKGTSLDSCQIDTVHPTTQSR